MITIRNVRKRYRKQTVLNDVSLHIPAGEIFALLGPNGSGKTTLLKLLLGLVHPDGSGTMHIAGASIVGERAYRRQIGYMSQWPQYPPHLTVCELITLFAQLRNAKGVHTEALLEEMQMRAFWQKPFGELSGGMAQKVNIVQCFMFNHALFILDEPTAGLDPHTAFYLKRLIRERKKSGATLLFTSHVMSEVDALADHMALLVDGTVSVVTSPAELKQAHHTTSLEEAVHHVWRSVSDA
ncbi:MAG: ABC transporter ATP-binding protein [Deltaproteobacteria bacterium]|nr:ABC transporter ATP-binding protein [Deltaproteobacteria bacterium]